LLAGFCQACLYVVSRKATQSSGHLLSLAACFQVGPALFILPFTPLVDDGIIENAVSEWRIVSIVIVTLSVLIATSSLAFSHGAKWVPAAMSATADTATLMASGYFVEAILFDKPIGLYPLVGAMLMLLSVCVMAASKVPTPRLLRQDARVAAACSAVTDEASFTDIFNLTGTPSSTADCASTSSNASNTAESGEASVENAEAGAEREGLVSFIASEFVDTEPQKRFPLRKRLPQGDMSGILPVAHQFGAASAVRAAIA